MKSCDVCQRTLPKHLVPAAPLEAMPLIDTPFKRVEIDIVGPFQLRSQGNIYVLTMVDFAIRYPDAVALPVVKSKTVAEEVLQMFSRVGLRQEIVSDRGTSST